MKNLKQRIDQIRRAFNEGDGRTMPWHERLPDFEIIDEVLIGVKPRYKTSGLSGDEWRQSVSIVAKFKGVTVFEKTVRDIEVALGMLYAFKIEACDEGIPDAVLKREKECCDQPSCSNRARNFYLLKKRHSQGNRFEKDALAVDDQGHYRQFCNRHARRGDCCLNDTDANYIPVIGGPQNAAMPDEDLSPSAGPVVIDVDLNE